GEKALDGAIAAAFARPACEPSHRHPPRHGHHRHDDTAQLADRGGGHVRTGTVQQCYNIDHRCAPLWCVRCRLGQRNSTRQRTTLPYFWRRYCFIKAMEFQQVTDSMLASQSNRRQPGPLIEHPGHHLPESELPVHTVAEGLGNMESIG